MTEAREDVFIGDRASGNGVVDDDVRDKGKKLVQHIKNTKKHKMQDSR